MTFCTMKFGEIRFGDLRFDDARFSKTRFSDLRGYPSANLFYSLDSDNPPVDSPSCSEVRIITLIIVL